MFNIRQLIKNDPCLYNLFIKKYEYIIERPDRYNEYKVIDPKINIYDPKISSFLLRKNIKIYYPNNKKFALCLTHDVDKIYPNIKHYFYSILYNIEKFDLDINNLIQLKDFIFWKKNFNQSPYINLNEIIHLEKKYDANSTFFLLAKYYNFEDKKYLDNFLVDDFESILENNFEIGLHGDYYTFNNIEKIKIEKLHLEKIMHNKIFGYRNHYLRFKIPDTWEYLEKLGFKYDSSYGFNDNVGFRNGLCHPFQPYNMIKDKDINLIEIPIIIMDSALFQISTNINNAWENTKNLIKIVKKNNGILTLIWHNETFNCPFRSDWLKLYQNILKYCYNENAWMTCCRDITNWWKNILLEEY